MIDIRGLSYFVAESADPVQWQRYAEDVLGMMVTAAPAGGLYVKMDERPFRMLIVPGGESRYLASGWELANEKAFNAAIETLDQADVSWRRVPPSNAISAVCKRCCTSPTLRATAMN